MTLQWLLTQWAKARRTSKATKGQFCGDATTKITFSIITNSLNPSYPDSKTVYACQGSGAVVPIPGFCC